MFQIYNKLFFLELFLLVPIKGLGISKLENIFSIYRKYVQLQKKNIKLGKFYKISSTK